MGDALPVESVQLHCRRGGGELLKQRFGLVPALLEELAAGAPAVKLYRLYRERIAHFRANPPGADWDGVFGFSTKVILG